MPGGAIIPHVVTYVQAGSVGTPGSVATSSLPATTRAFTIALCLVAWFDAVIPPSTCDPASIGIILPTPPETGT